MGEEIREARRRRQKRQTQLEEASAAESALVRQRAEYLAGYVLDDLEIPFVNGGARKDAVAAIAGLLVRLAVADRVTPAVAAAAIREALQD